MQLSTPAGPRTGLLIRAALPPRFQAPLAERRLAAIFANSRDAIIGATPDLRISGWNPAAETMFGYAAREAEGLPVAALIAQERRPRIAQRLATLQSGKALRSLESVCLRKDGTRIDVEITVSPVPGDDGAPPWYFAIVRDISERKLVEGQLRESQRRFEEIAGSISEVFWTADPQTTRILYVSPGYERVWGRSCASLYQNPRSFIDGIHPDDRPVVLAALECQRAGRDSAGEYRVVRPDGTVRHIWDRGYAQRDPVTGVVTHYVGVAVDVTDRKNQESALSKSMEAIVQALVSTVEMRDPYTSGHQLRVAELAVAIGRRLGLAPERRRGLELAAQIHDIGKLVVPAEILAKPGKLSRAEFELVRDHAAAGAGILKGIEFPWPLREILWQHHERQDGSGYPRGLRGQAILLEARIIAVADTVEAMSSHRPYRAALGIESALAEIEGGRGTRYDAAVVDACLELFRGQPSVDSRAVPQPEDLALPVPA